MAPSNSTTLRPFDFDIAYVPGRVDFHYDITAADEFVAEIQYAAHPCATCGGEGDCPDCGTLVEVDECRCNGWGCRVCEADASWSARAVQALDGDEDEGDDGRANSTRAPQVGPVVMRTYWCFVDGCSYEPRHLFGDNGLCCGHFGTCDCQIDPPVEPDPAARPARPRQPGPARVHPLRRRPPGRDLPADPPGPLTCGGCGAPDHGIQTCPAVRALLFAPTTNAERMAARVDPQLLARAVAA